jgi:uncharacterized protein YtpQ (UPF0354 family)
MEQRKSIGKCDKAIPYIKPSLKGAEATVQLKREDEPVLRNLGNGLLVAYLVDIGEVFEYIQVRDLIRAGLTEEELHERSMANLVALMNARLDIKPYGNVSAVFLDGNIESSLLLVDELWDSRLASMRKYGFIAVAPARDVLAFTDVSSSQGIAELREIASRAEGGDHLISPVLFRRRGKLWVRHVD